jgi:hypothetical protein
LIEERLADGEWHELMEMFPQVSLLLDPRFAMRRWQRMHDARHTDCVPGAGEECEHFEFTRALQYGLWASFTDMVRHGARNGRLELERGPRRRQGRVRLSAKARRNGFQAELVANQGVHEV